MSALLKPALHILHLLHETSHDMMTRILLAAARTNHQNDVLYKHHETMVPCLHWQTHRWSSGIILGSGAVKTYNGINLGIATINHPPNDHKWVVETIKNGWFIIAIPTLPRHRDLMDKSLWTVRKTVKFKSVALTVLTRWASCIELSHFELQVHHVENASSQNQW